MLGCEGNLPSDHFSTLFVKASHSHRCFNDQVHETKRKIIVYYLVVEYHIYCTPRILIFRCIAFLRKEADNKLLLHFILFCFVLHVKYGISANVYHAQLKVPRFYDNFLHFFYQPKRFAEGHPGMYS